MYLMVVAIEEWSLCCFTLVINDGIDTCSKDIVSEALPTLFWVLPAIKTTVTVNKFAWRSKKTGDQDIATG